MKITNKFKIPRAIKKELKKVDYDVYNKNGICVYIFFGIRFGKVFNKQTRRLISLINKSKRINEKDLVQDAINRRIKLLKREDNGRTKQS